MQLRRSGAVGLAVALAILLSAAWSARGAESPAETVTVSKTYNNAPFAYQIRLLAERATYRVYRLTYPSPVVTPLVQNNTVPAEYYLPKAIRPDGPKYPAVICLHILDGNEPLTELVCSVLANRGIPAISFKLPYYGVRGTSKGPEAMADDPRLFVSAMAQTGEDIRRTIDLLGSRPEIDAERIGITGISLGGIIAATAAGAEPRLHRAGLILTGGDLLKIIHHARETQPLSAMIQKLPLQERAELEAKIAAVDPLRFAPALRDRAQAGRVLMLNAAEDEVIPHECTEALATALGISDRVVWWKGLGHYTAVAELPQALRTMAEFFARDLPEGTQNAPPVAEATGPRDPARPRSSALQQLVCLLQQAMTIVATEPQPGCCHRADLEVTAWTFSGHVRFVRGTEGRFVLQCKLPEVGDVSIGQGRFPWMIAGGKTLFAGVKNAAANRDVLRFLDPRSVTILRMAQGVAGSVAMAPEMLLRWAAVTDGEAPDGGRVIGVMTPKDTLAPSTVRLTFQKDGVTPREASLSVAIATLGTLKFRQWEMNVPAGDADFEPPAGLERQEVESADVARVFSALLDFAVDYGAGRGRPAVNPNDKAIAVIARDPAGHGLLCRTQGKTILLVSGTPAQMGAAHGALLRGPAQKLTQRVLYLVGGGDTLRSGQWFLDRMADIERRTVPHIPPRFLEECDALARAAGVSQRDGRYANLFPERFHCSGVALRGKATAGGRVLHARVLDYMREIDLQEAAVVVVFMPDGRHKWMTLGYAGFIGTVTAMNEKGLAIGEMGGRCEGQWDGIPMSLLLRDVMERAATVDQAVAILRAAPRTCEYYYVVSDRSGAMRALHCTPQQMTVLEPGQQHPRLPLVPDDVVLVSGDDRAKLLSQRIQENYGQIDVPRLMNIIKRPVAMESNLHDAIFAPESLEMWFADAGKRSPACDEPYARVNLGELIQFYAEQVGTARRAAK